MAATAIAPREWDAQGNPVQAGATTASVTEWDAAGNPVSGRPTLSPQTSPAPPEGQGGALSDLLDMGKLLPALIHAKMLGTDPKLTYAHGDDIEQRFSAVAGDFATRIGKAATVKDDPLYMLMKGRGPEPFESHDKLEQFINDMSEFVGDPFLYGPAILGTLLGSSRLGTTAGFALDSGLRKALADHYQKGDATSFGEIASRTAATIWAAAKGATIGEVMGFAGNLPVPQFAAGRLASTALRGLYQATSMEVAGSILDWHAPSLQSFERNAIMVGGFGLIHQGVAMTIPDVKQAMLDVYAKDGKTPEQTTEHLQAQPPVKEAPKPGLSPAIRITAKDVPDIIYALKVGEALT